MVLYRHVVALESNDYGVIPSCASRGGRWWGHQLAHRIKDLHLRGKIRVCLSRRPAGVGPVMVFENKAMVLLVAKNGDGFKK
jgi:hypothetical protein